MRLITKQIVSAPMNPDTVRVMSYNIRMAPCPEDDATENAWVYRLPKINMILDQYVPDIIGVQEVSAYQMGTFKTGSYKLPYEFIGKYPTRTPRESGLGIIYNLHSLVQISPLYTIWLNESQNSPEGPAWDSSNYERYLIYAKFQHRHTNCQFWFMTTHFDHWGIRAREESAKIAIDLAASVDAPAILTGDFNCFPQLGGQKLYETLCSRSQRIKDSGKRARSTFGVPGSWIGWSYDPYRQQEGHATYDFIFVHETITVIQHGIIDDRVWDDQLNKELYPSDHRPVIGDVQIA